MQKLNVTEKDFRIYVNRNVKIIIHYQDFKNVFHKSNLHETTGHTQDNATTFPRPDKLYSTLNYRYLHILLLHDRKSIDYHLRTIEHETFFLHLLLEVN